MMRCTVGDQSNSSTDLSKNISRRFLRSQLKSGHIKTGLNLSNCIPLFEYNPHLTVKFASFHLFLNKYV